VKPEEKVVKDEEEDLDIPVFLRSETWRKSC
jgi:hypothetical protein